MREKLDFAFEKILLLYHKFMSGGRIGNVMRLLLFVFLAILLGCYISLKVFFPDDFVLSKINSKLTSYEIGIEGDDVYYSLLFSFGIENGKITKKGETALLFGSLTGAPSIFSMFSSDFSGSVSIDNINEKGGRLNADIDLGKDPCFAFDAEELPASIIKMAFPDVKMGGSLDGLFEICNKKKKFSGDINMKGNKLTLGGKIMSVSIENIDLGKMILEAKIKDNKMDIKKMTFNGAFDIKMDGKITMNPTNFNQSRLDIGITLKETKKGELAKIPLLEMMLGQYKDATSDSYNIRLTGSIASPLVRRDSRAAREKTDETNNNKK